MNTPRVRIKGTGHERAGGLVRTTWARDRFDVLLDWVLARNAWYLVRALPALVVLVAAAVLVLLIALYRPERRQDAYREAGRNALGAEDWATAALAYQRVVLSGDGSLEARFRWAVAADRLHDTERVEALLETLAPADRLGLPAAHLWRAKRLLAGTSDGARLQAAEGHLRRVLAAEPNTLEARAILGNVCLAGRRPVEALEHFLRALPGRPDLQLTVAGLYAQQGQPDRAIAHARLAQAHYRPLSEARPDEAMPRLRWAEATVVTGDPAAAVVILEAGLARKDEPVYRQALGQVYLAWSEAVAREKPDQLHIRLQLLDQSLRHDVSNLTALARLLELARTEGEAGAQAKAVLNQLLAQGQSADTVHLLLGLQARGAGMTAEAREHFEQAYRLRPELAVAVNNLAWALAHAEPPDLPRALKLIDSVLERSPQVARFRETRGQILARQGRWRDAITDLELALPHMSNHAALHATLAQAYRQLGMPDPAREHEKLAAAAAPASPVRR
jgi:tetratricopeptide (TPR) repeat protein